MKKIGISFLLLFGLLGQQLMAQLEEQKFSLLDRVVPHVGFVQMIPFQTVDDALGPETIRDIFANRGTVIFTNFHVGAYTTIFHHKDVVSVGIDNSVQIGISPNFQSPALPTAYNIQVPIFIMGRLGAGSTPYNQQQIGISAGIGGSINHMKFTMFRPNDNTAIDDAAVVRTTTFVTPSAVLELSYRNLIGRLHLGLAPVNTRVTDEFIGVSPALIEENQAVHGIFGYGLIYHFN
ncbi:MAG: hypothetical protein MRZ79_13180 [Bacteroidia bacterium]|nr:hypothetical protein [Bacteroidia bacterium]